MALRFGLLLILAGLILRFLAVRELGADWSNVQREPETIVTSGIYSQLNHPAYVGSVLIFAGLFLVVPVRYHAAVTVLFIAAFYKNLADREDHLLREK